MLFTWNTKNLCIVFESWHIRSTAGLIFSLLAVILIGMGYEALRAGTRRYEILMRRRVESTPSEFASGLEFLLLYKINHTRLPRLLRPDQWSAGENKRKQSAWCLSNVDFFLASENTIIRCLRAKCKMLTHNPRW